MAHCRSTSRNIHRSTTQNCQSEAPLRRSARLSSLTQANTTGAFNPPGQKSLDFRVPATVACHKVDQTKHLEPRPKEQKRAKDYYDLRSCKRRRISRQSPVQASSQEDLDPIDHWRRSGFHWPQGDWPKNKMDRYLPRKKTMTTLRRKRSESELGALSTTTPSTNSPSDQKTREQKSAEYRDVRYNALLAAKGSLMHRDPVGIQDESKKICQRLLETEQSVPSHTLFSDDSFEQVCQALQDKNEARVIRDISLLLVPSAEDLSMRGEKELKVLIDSVNEGWNNSMPFTKTRPQPDYAVGFRREAFTEDRLKKIGPFVGDIITELSLFMGTYYLHFPFLTCEVKCGAAALDIADRQNAHSMTLAVRGVVELFRLVGREKELNREILAFSISHDHRSVRIYGHYAVIEGKDTTYYRYSIHEFGFAALEGRDKWTSYKFTKNVYKIWMPMHFKRLCSAIDDIPVNLDFGVSQAELRYSETSGLSQDITSHHLSESDAATTGGRSSQLEPIVSLEETPDTSLTRSSGQNKSKKHKKKP